MTDSAHRGALIATYAINDAMNQLILSNLDPKAWRAKLPGAAPGPRTVGAIFAHLHNVRLRWRKRNAPHLKRPAPLDPHRCTIEQTSSALKVSGELCLKMLTEALSGGPDGRITEFRRDSWMPTWTANPAMFAYMFGHEEHHRGQILMLVHQLGYRINQNKISAIWYWDKLWKQAGIPRPRWGSRNKKASSLRPPRRIGVGMTDMTPCSGSGGLILLTAWPQNSKLKSSCA